MIQHSLKKDLAKDVTLLIVAHRLQTVMDADKIVSRLKFVSSTLSLMSLVDGP